MILFAALAVFWSLKRSAPPAEKPAVVTSTATAPATPPAPPPPAPAAQPEPATAPAETSAAAQSRTSSAAGRERTARAPSSRSTAADKTERAEQKTEQKTDEEPASKATAQFQPESTPTSTAAPAAPAPPPAPPPATAVSGSFQNRVGGSFKLLNVTVTLDGKRVYSGAGGKSLELFQATVPPGSHNLAVHAEYKANSGGVFSYAEGYRFGVQGGRRFTTTEGRPLRITMTGYERGGPTTAFEDRLALAVSAH